MNSLRAAGLAGALLVCLARMSGAEQEAIVPDLTRIVEEEGWEVVNREAEIGEAGDSASIYFKAQPGDGVAWLEDVEFTDGILEADIKGSDARGRSFVGIAFRGNDESTYDAIYFRPFNFRSDDPVRKGHSVQYISHPDNTWSRLREEHPEKYENPVDPPPEPNSFFHAKIVVEGSKISVHVNDDQEPCLVVEGLTDNKSGRVGLWMGNNSDGTFANLKIIPASN